MKQQSYALLMVLILGLAAGPLAAQVTTAGIHGTVMDRTSAVVPNADVTVTNTETNFTRTVRSDGAGEYTFTALPLGPYRLEALLRGFKKHVQTGIVLDVNRTARVEIVLELGTQTDSVAVSADAPLINVDDAQMGRTVGTKEINQLPLVNRDVYSLLNLTPGVEMNSTGNTVGFRQTTVAINGSNDSGAGSVNYYLDGGANMTGLRNTGNSTPNPDAVREFRVITNGYSAEFGRFTAGVVDVVTKSGTNQIHGSLFEFVRNDKLDANTWGAISKPPLRRNQFGGAFGGPIKKDKLFFFGSYSGLRQRQQDFNNGAIVPTAAERIGDFSQSAKKPVFAGIVNGVIPTTLLDPVAVRIINNYVPAANLPGQHYQYTQGRPSDGNDVNFKIDYNATNAHQIVGSYFYTKGQETQPSTGNMPWSQQLFTWKQQNFNVGDTWSVSPTVINQLRLTYVRNFGGRLNTPDLSLGDLGSTFNIQGAKSLPAINISGYMNFTQAIQGPIAGSNYYGVRDSVSWMRGKHTVKAGVDGQLEKVIQDTSLNNYGVFSFDGKKTGNALADFMLGVPGSFKQDMPTTKIDNEWYAGFFVQDDYRIHPRFTLNLGLRYEMPLAITDPHDRKMAFVPGVQSTIAPNAPVGLLFPGDPGIGRGIIQAPRKNFAPRLGMAWDPKGDGKTSIRASAGVFWGSISSNIMNLTADFQPFAARQTFPTVNTLSDPYKTIAGGSPFPITYDPKNPKFITPADVSTIAPNFKFPYTYQLNFSVQRQVTKDLSVTAGYVGSLAHRLPFSVDSNYAGWTPGATSANLNTRRPYLPGTLGIIWYEDSLLNSSYHGLQTTVEKRMSRGFTLYGYYTFSKSLEDAQSQNNQPTGGAEDYRNLSLERARTNNDRRHNFVLSAIWEINYFKGNRALEHLLNRWSVSAIGRMRSGTPFTVTTGQDTNLDGNNNDRADLVGNAKLDPHRSRSDASNMWFNTAAFKVPVVAVSPDGNAGRNILDSPGQKFVDMGFFRVFQVMERMKLEFRAELTNALNVVNLSTPTANMNSADFGAIRTAGGMRQTQLGLRLFW